MGWGPPRRTGALPPLEPPDTRRRSQPLELFLTSCPGRRYLHHLDGGRLFAPVGSEALKPGDDVRFFAATRICTDVTYWVNISRCFGLEAAEVRTRMANCERYCLPVVALAAFLAGCAAQQPQPAPLIDDAYLPALETYSGLAGIESSIPPDSVDSITRRLAEQGIRNLAAGDLVGANQHFNQALMFDPADSALQWLNGVAYHLRVVQGEASQFPMAREAYSLAIQFDPSNWRAYHQLGLLYLDNQNYRAAQSAFAEAILFRPRDPDLIYQMLYAAYYSHNPDVAAAALSRLQSLEPESERTLRAAPLVLAAVGEHDNAVRELSRYQENTAYSPESLQLGDRVEDWNGFYRYHNDGMLNLASAAENADRKSVV